MLRSLFITALATLMAHKLDAAYRKEWRILPFLRKLQEPLARDLFIFSHILIFAGAIWICVEHQRGAMRSAALVLDVFMIVHVGLHQLWRNDHLSDFSGPVSRLLIWGAAALGGTHFVMSVVGVR